MRKKYKHIPSANVKLNIVIPVYGQLDMLRKCLLSIPDNPEYHVIVVDNNTPDQEKAKAIWKEFETKITLLKLIQNRGFAIACNLGAKQVKSKYTLFLNSDVELLPGCIEKMVEDLDNDPQVGIVGAKLLFPLDHPNESYRGKIQHAGIACNINSQMIHQFLGWSADAPKANVRENIGYVTGALLMVRTAQFIQFGKFFEGYGMGSYEDVDLCLTFRSKGYTILYEPYAVAYHFAGASYMENKVSQPQAQNKNLFQLRWKGKFGWDEWKRW